MSTGTGLRTALFTPADRPDRVTKALQLPTDAVIVDLEDAVHDSAKAEARARIRAYAALDRRPGLALLVRVNALGTPFAETDVAAIALPGVDGVVLPMVSTSDDLVETDQVLTRAERAAGLREGAIPVIAIIETAAGVTGLSGLAQRPLRLSGLARKFVGGHAARGWAGVAVSVCWRRSSRSKKSERSLVVNFH